MRRYPALEALSCPCSRRAPSRRRSSGWGRRSGSGCFRPAANCRPSASCGSLARPCARLRTLVQSGHLVSLRGRQGGTFVVEQPPLAEQAGDEPLDQGDWAVLDHWAGVEIEALEAAVTDRERYWGFERL